MRIQRGDIVLLRAPFTSREGAKARPMLVVQNDVNNARMSNTILVYITSNTTRSNEPTQVLVDICTPDGLLSGLSQTSVISCENILTVVQADILQTLGYLPDALMQRVNEAMRVSLGIP